jgi:hypothetical protein
VLKPADLTDPSEGIYTFVDSQGRNTNVASNRLRDWTIKARPETFLFPVDSKLAQRFLHDNIVTFERVLEIAMKKRLDPVIFCHDGTYTDGAPNCMLVDGHHRYCYMGLSKQPVIPGHLLTPDQWKPFEIEGLCEITQNQLLAMPNKPRNY